MTNEELAQAFALQKIRKTPGFAALEAFLQRRHLDLFRRWREADKPGASGPSSFTPEYCRGAADVLESLVSDIDGWIVQAEESKVADDRQDAAEANEQLGRGDLVL
jgi:hypothetical protein